jgi:hypothetical protein
VRTVLEEPLGSSTCPPAWSLDSQPFGHDAPKPAHGSEIVYTHAHRGDPARSRPVSRGVKTNMDTWDPSGQAWSWDSQSFGHDAPNPAHGSEIVYTHAHRGDPAGSRPVSRGLPTNMVTWDPSGPVQSWGATACHHLCRMALLASSVRNSKNSPSLGNM